MSDRAREVVETLLERLHSGAILTDPDSVGALFAADASYLVGPEFPLVTGRDGVVAEIKRQTGTYSDLVVTMLAVISDGSSVVTERIDEFTLTHNGVRAANPLLAVFDVNPAGQITSWREYWDAQSLGKFIRA